MKLAKLSFENWVLKMQSTENIRDVFFILLNMFNIGDFGEGSYLLIKSPFQHKKYIINGGIINEKELIEDEFKVKETDSTPPNKYSINKTQHLLSGYWMLSAAEIEINLYLKGKLAESIELVKFLPSMIAFFIMHLNLLLNIEHLRMHSIKDDLTLLFNQNYLKSFIEREINRSKRYNLHFSVIFFDLDYLKEINEQHGHLVGTEVLKEVSRILQNSIRKIDIVSRFGGDEFVIVLADSDPELALQICKRLRDKIKSNHFLEKDGLNLKISGCFGIANFPQHGSSVDDLIKKADMAMFKVKRSGKDGINVYRET